MDTYLLNNFQRALPELPEKPQEKPNIHNGHRIHEVLFCPTCNMSFENTIDNGDIKPVYYKGFPSIHLDRISCPYCYEAPIEKLLAQKEEPEFMDSYYTLATYCSKRFADEIFDSIERGYPGVSKIVENKKIGRNRKFDIQIKNSYWIDMQIKVLEGKQ